LRKVRILLISTWFPYPPDNGSKIRAYNLLRHLAAAHEITLLSFMQHESQSSLIPAIEPFCQQVRVTPEIPFQPQGLRSALALLSPRPRSVVQTFNPTMARMVRDAQRQVQFDLVLALQIKAAPYALLVDTVPRILEELEVTIAYEDFSRRRSLWQRVRRGMHWLKFRRYARHLLERFDACTVVSEEELSRVETFAAPCRLAVVPNAIDVSQYVASEAQPQPSSLIHTGALTYWANYDAVDYFVSAIYPLIKSAVPEAVFRITGDTAGVPLEKLQTGDGVVFTGYLQSVQPAIANSWACVVPLRVGGGTRFKVLEALALGTPVVATSKGVEGLGFTHDREVLIADDPQAFARHTIALLLDPDLRERLAQAGRKVVAERYDWCTVAAKLDTLLEAVIGQGTR
jgi:glycosyltransferase involved in cell wall biosynthesis